MRISETCLCSFIRPSFLSLFCSFPTNPRAVVTRTGAVVRGWSPRGGGFVWDGELARKTEKKRGKKTSRKGVVSEEMGHSVLLLAAGLTLDADEI